jgi:hypothetical protein
MNKPLGADDLLKQIRELPLEEREYVAAELIKEVDEAGGHLEDPPEFVEMIRAQAQRAVEHPEEAIPGDQFFEWLDKLRARARRA